MTNSNNEWLEYGEDSVLELKSVRVPGQRVVAPDTKDVADELAAAANTVGATFFFGIDDKTRRVEGIPEDKIDIVETWLRDICNDSIKPALVATIRKIAMCDDNGISHCVLRVDVPSSLFVHESPHGYFYRIGSSKRKMAPEMLARLFQQRSQTRLICFDEQVVTTAAVEELEPGLFRRFRGPISPGDDKEFLRKLHFTALDAEGVFRPTVSGILFATHHPEYYLPSAYIQAVCYRGTERNADEQLDARDIIGPLDEQIVEACRFVVRNMRIAAIKNPARIDIPQYAMNAVFEAIVNAVAHRDYSISGAKIRLHMFANRLEIFSPGGLPNSMTLDEITERQFARNELICTCLSRCAIPEGMVEVLRTQMMDRRGEGVPVILAATQNLSDSMPEYRLLNEAELLLTIPAAPIDDNSKLHDVVMKKLVSDDKKLVSDDKKLVSCDKKLVSCDKKLVSCDKKLVSGGTDANIKKQSEGIALLSRPTRERIMLLQSRFGGESFSLTDVMTVMPRSTAIRLMAKMKKLQIIQPTENSGRYHFVALNPLC